MWPKKRRSVKLSNTSISPSVSAVEVAGNIDLTTEILLRLPVKSLIRFKSVSKLWLSLISDPKFSRLHHSRSHSTSAASGLFLKSFHHEYNFVNLNTHPSTPPFRSLAFGSERSAHRISHSSNGLLLCSNYYHPDVWRRSFHVFNPATKHYTTLPRLPRHTRGPSNCPTTFGIALAFDPSRSAQYKVVCVRHLTNSDPSRFQIDIYSSQTGPWRPSSAGYFEADYETLFHRGVFWNGCLHWINPWGESLRFDVDAELVHQMPMPPVPHSLAGIDRSSGYFGESGGFLHFVDHLLEPGESRFKVYEMERDYSGWSVKYIVDVSEVSRAFPEMILGTDSNDNGQMEYLFSVLCVVRCEIEEESFLVMSIPGKVLRCRFENRAFCKLCDVPEMVLKPSEAYQYIASLACV